MELKLSLRIVVKRNLANRTKRASTNKMILVLVVMIAMRSFMARKWPWITGKEPKIKL
jgi:hypothetical protein